MSTLPALTGAPLSAEAELARIFMGLQAAHTGKTIKLTADNPAVQEPVFSWSIANYPNEATNPQKLVLVAYLPLPNNLTELSGKIWANVAEVGSTSIPSAFGAR